MKRILLCAFFVLVFSLTGCAEKEQSNNNTVQNNGQNQEVNDQENNTQPETNNGAGQETVIDISIKDWVETVTIDGIKWTEFSESNVTEIFGNVEDNKEAENTRSISFTDVNGQEYTGTIRHEETREDEVVLRYMPDNGSEDFAVHFEFEKNNANVQVLDGIRISRSVESAMKDILLAWGIDKIDAKAFEIATNAQNSEESEYYFTCTTDYGRARVLVENDINDEGYREIEVQIDFDDRSVPYSIDLMEVYEGNNSENVKYFEIYLDR